MVKVINMRSCKKEEEERIKQLEEEGWTFLETEEEIELLFKNDTKLC